jgi:hypothetical protein
MYERAFMDVRDEDLKMYEQMYKRLNMSDKYLWFTDVRVFNSN